MRYFSASLLMLLSGCVSSQAPRALQPSPEGRAVAWAGQGLELRSEGEFVLSWTPNSDGSGQCVLRRLHLSPARVEAWRATVSQGAFAAFLAGDGRIGFEGGVALVGTAPFATRSESDGGQVLALEASAEGTLISLWGKTRTLRAELRVMNLNVLNYWDGNPTNTPEERLFGYDEFRPGFSNWYDPNIQNSKAESVARALVGGGLPDVVALQELEWAGGRSEVFDRRSPLRKRLEELGYNFFLLGPQGAENEVAITTGFVSRYALADEPPVVFNNRDKEFQDFSEKERNSIRYSTRNIQVASLRVGGRVLRLFNNHWRSKGCSDEAGCERSERVREANGKVLARALNETRKRFPSDEFLVLGDFNSEYSDEGLAQVGTTSEPLEVQPLASSSKLFNPWYELPESLRWERSFAGKKITLSHILLGASLFDQSGFQYRSRSFHAVGQQGEAARLFLNADGEPLRWQTEKLRSSEAPADARKAMEDALAQRGCGGEHASKRRCKVSYTRHIGVGGFDHLPVMATLRLTGVGDVSRTTFPLAPEGGETHKGLADFVGPCAEDAATVKGYPELGELDLEGDGLVGRCVRYEPGMAETLATRGIYEADYVMVKGHTLGFSMFGAYDPRPTHSARTFASSSMKMHDLSDMCFVRKVLQKEGGKVKSAVGRLGYDNGTLTLFLGTRSSISLVDLPEEKRNACMGK